MKIIWPGGRKFAFTFCDDTDYTTVKNVKPIYDLLAELGMRTTKLVWLFRGSRVAGTGGETCEDPHHVDWLLSLQQQGFEIGLHNVAGATSPRELVIQGLDRFNKLFGSPPKLHCNHSGCLDNLYWGDARITGWRRTLYNVWTRGKRKNFSRGHIPGDPVFWGDLCREQIIYVRNFTFDGLNTLKICPQMPYHDPRKPFVNYWFAATNGSRPKYFRQNFTLRNIDRLIEEGGLCIAYVHFGAKFARENKIDNHFKTMLEYVASKDGWFAPVSEVLHFLAKGEDLRTRSISISELQRIELRWLWGRFGTKMDI
jgi:hypothetical protein